MSQLAILWLFVMLGINLAFLVINLVLSLWMLRELREIRLRIQMRDKIILDWFDALPKPCTSTCLEEYIENLSKAYSDN